MEHALVTTTIFVPTFLKAYTENFKQHRHNVAVYVIGDKKTPSETREFCKTIPNCTYMDLVDQKNYMVEHGHEKLWAHLPPNSISLRNIGHLMAYEEGAVNIMMLDDDNLALNYDVIGHHGVVGHRLVRETYTSTSGWLNVCRALEEENGVTFYPRGYPPAQRWNTGFLSVETTLRRIAVNAGLWINDPDVDAITRLERPLKVLGRKADMPASFALEPGTWSPWNCQNTAISRAALPSYFLSPYAGRHLDIWASYITNRVAEAMGEVVTFGMPLANHERTPHDLYNDLTEEVPWIRKTDDFVKRLRDIEVTETTYLGVLQQVIDGLKASMWPQDWYLEGLQIWHDTFARLGAK